MIKIDQDRCTDIAVSSTLEWLETNGIGGFASGTVAGALTRRYHALLTAATRPPLGRVSMLSKLEETLVVSGERFELSSNIFPDDTRPQGCRFITSFRLDPLPVWTYEAGGMTVEKRVFMPHGENTAVVRYMLDGDQGDGKVTLEVRPLVSFVDYHSLQHENDRFSTSFLEEPGRISIRPYDDLPPMYLFHDARSVAASGHWYRDFILPIESERGFDDRQELYQPFALEFDLSREAFVIASTRDSVGKARELEENEVRRRKELVEQSGAADELPQQLVLAADQFIVGRAEGKTVIAGYPWFADWGRDTMIALPGLTLAAGRPDVARSIILEYADHISEGMLPNRFPDAGHQPEYNTVDAILWFFEAIRAVADSTGDHTFIRGELYDKLVDIIGWHLRGTRYGIHIDTDGLLYAGNDTVNLTWMDAKIDDRVITPRTGKAVEIQALWYNALRTMVHFAEVFGIDRDAARFGAMADLARLSFNSVFWNAEGDYLFDVVENGSRDASVRPNQIFAVSLEYSMLDDTRAGKVLDRVEGELLTPFGLRSLSPHDPDYVPIYRGSPLERDSSYHQGTVWAWLIGAYVDACVRVRGIGGSEVKQLLASFAGHLTEAGLGQISEIFDADPPHLPRGCPAQAWSVGEVLRVYERYCGRR